MKFNVSSLANSTDAYINIERNKFKCQKHVTPLIVLDNTRFRFNYHLWNPCLARHYAIIWYLLFNLYFFRARNELDVHIYILQVRNRKSV